MENKKSWIQVSFQVSRSKEICWSIFDFCNRRDLWMTSTSPTCVCVVFCVSCIEFAVPCMVFVHSAFGGLTWFNTRQQLQPHLVRFISSLKFSCDSHNYFDWFKKYRVPHLCFGNQWTLTSCACQVEVLPSPPAPLQITWHVTACRVNLSGDPPKFTCASCPKKLPQGS